MPQQIYQSIGTRISIPAVPPNLSAYADLLSRANTRYRFYGRIPSGITRRSLSVLPTLASPFDAILCVRNPTACGSLCADCRMYYSCSSV